MECSAIRILSQPKLLSCRSYSFKHQDPKILVINNRFQGAFNHIIDSITSPRDVINICRDPSTPYLGNIHDGRGSVRTAKQMNRMLDNLQNEFPSSSGDWSNHGKFIMEREGRSIDWQRKKLRDKQFYPRHTLSMSRWCNSLLIDCLLAAGWC